MKFRVQPILKFTDIIPTMTDIRALIDSLSEVERTASRASFLAPCVRGGRVRARVRGLVREYVPQPEDFEGWGIFVPADERTASLLEPAAPPIVDRYLALFPAVRLRLAFRLDGRSWCAFPANISDAEQRFGTVGPVTVQLAEQVNPFERIIGSWDGSTYWFVSSDRRADPRIRDRLNEALAADIGPDDLRVRGLTPEDRCAYELRWNLTTTARRAREERQDLERLERGLAQGGGTLDGYMDRGDVWVVRWRTAAGEGQRSVIRKNDLTVVGAGICLSGQDRNFDLQSLVGVIENRPDWM